MPHYAVLLKPPYTGNEVTLQDFTQAHIDTPRLTLRALIPLDSEALFSIFSDPDVMRYWNTPPWTSVVDAEKFIAEHRSAMLSDEWITLGIYSNDDGTLLGKCMLFHYDRESRRAEIGFGIARSAWGKGYIQEAASALIDYAINTMQLRRIEAEIDPENIASGKTLERLGFVQEGLLRQRWQINGVVSDSALYGLLAKHWPANISS